MQFCSTFDADPGRAVTSILITCRVLVTGPLAASRLEGTTCGMQRFAAMRTVDVFKVPVGGSTTVRPRSACRSSVSRLNGTCHRVIRRRGRGETGLLGSGSEEGLFEEVTSSSGWFFVLPRVSVCARFTVISSTRLTGRNGLTRFISGTFRR